MNLLVRAGLIPAHLADILATPLANAATQRRVRRITKARVLTPREYVEMMEEKKNKEKASLSLFCSWYAVLYSLIKCLSWFDFVLCLSSSFLSVAVIGGIPLLSSSGFRGEFISVV